MPSRPNILIFLNDSTSVRHLGCYGDHHSITPNLDRMATEGICFRNAFAVTPLCHPSRSGMLTGLYPHTNGTLVNSNSDPNCPKMNPALPTYYSLLHDAGYRCGLVGQHSAPNGASTAKGLDDVIAGYDRYKNERTKRQVITEPMGAPGKPYEGMPFGDVDDFRDYNYLQYGLDVFTDYLESDQPWVFTFEFDAPHYPNMPPKQFWEMISPDSCGLPSGAFDPLTDRDPRHREWRQRLGLDTWDTERWRGAVRLYRAVIALMDDLLGRLLEVGDDDNTLIIFSSDHGDLVGSHGIWSKYACMDDSITNVPLVMRWPKGIRSGLVDDSFVSSTDWLPTFCELAGIETPALHHGRSLTPFFQGEKPQDWRTGIATTYYGSGSTWYPLRAYRDDHYKYVFEPNGMDEFYDMQNDPFERKNLINDPQYRSLIQQYANKMAKELRRIGDSLASLVPIDGDYD